MEKGRYSRRTGSKLAFLSVFVPFCPSLSVDLNFLSCHPEADESREGFAFFERIAVYAVNILKKVVQFIHSLVIAARKGFDIRDFLYYGGLAMLGYGLWLHAPSIGLSVAGFLLMLSGYLTSGKEGK